MILHDFITLQSLQHRKLLLQITQKLNTNLIESIFRQTLFLKCRIEFCSKKKKSRLTPTLIRLLSVIPLYIYIIYINSILYKYFINTEVFRSPSDLWLSCLLLCLLINVDLLAFFSSSKNCRTYSIMYFCL